MVGTGNDPQKQLLSIIRNFATEKSQGGIISFSISHSFNFRALISIRTTFLISFLEIAKNEESLLWESKSKRLNQS